jgi:S1-C subfamily serine protease
MAMTIGSISIWQRAVLGLAAASVIFAGGLMAGSRLLTSQKTPSTSTELLARVNELDAELKQMRKPEKPPSEIISSARNAICFIVSRYRLSVPGEPTSRNLQYHLFATGFLTSDGIVVSNRHVMEPWFGDANAQQLIFHGFRPTRERVLAYFPMLSTPVELSDFVTSTEADVAIAHVKLPPAAVSPLPLAQVSGVPGDPVLVIGYPLGVTTMLAKSTALPYELSGLRSDQQQVDRLAQIKLIRPSVTQGHLSDVIGTSLMYDASTAHGSSGGPVLNVRGEVVGVNAALINGFNGTSLGVSVAALKHLLQNSDSRNRVMGSQSGRQISGAGSSPAN